MYQTAFYGKGGIGKSTMAANISVALAGKGNKMKKGSLAETNGNGWKAGGGAEPRRTARSGGESSPPEESDPERTAEGILFEVGEQFRVTD